MNTTIIQVPISKALRNQAVKTAKSSGFSSIQDAIRLFLTQFATSKIGISFEPKPIKLTPKSDRRYSKMIDEIESGKVHPFVAHTVEELMTHLHGKKS